MNISMCKTLTDICNSVKAYSEDDSKYLLNKILAHDIIVCGLDYKVLRDTIVSNCLIDYASSFSRRYSIQGRGVLYMCDKKLIISGQHIDICVYMFLEKQEPYESYKMYIALGDTFNGELTWDMI